MLTHALKSASTAKYSINTNRNVIKNVLIAMLNADLWILLNFERCFKKTIKIFKPILEALFIMSIGAGLLLAYGLMYMPNNRDYVHHGSQYPRSEITAITNAPSSDISFIERELIRLKNKALSLEISQRKMNIKLLSICKYEKLLDETLPDFASEAAGGSVIETPETEPFYQSNQFQAKIWGIPIWRPNYFTPRKIIQPWTQAGECWAFRGSNGNVEIELAHSALVDRVTLEHIPVAVSLTGSIDSAPREFNVVGKFRNKYFVLGTFMYNQNSVPSQTFQITNDEMKNVPFKIIMLQVLSNWGNPDYTCIYRFKVHGKMFDLYSDSLSSSDKRDK